MSHEPGRLYARFHKAALERPTEAAFTFVDPRSGNRTYTYEALFERVAEVASALEVSGAPHGDPFGILLGSQESQVIHYLAALRVGHVPAILTPPNRKLNRVYYLDTMAEVLRRSGFGAIVTELDDLVSDAVALAPFTLEPRDPDARYGHSGPRERRDAVFEEASFLQYSSGTTGFKRGVLVRDDAVLDQLDVYAGALGLSDRDRIVGWLPLYHDMGFIACLNMPLAFGVHSVMIDPIDWVTNPALFVRAASDHGATLSWNPNFAYAFMAQRIRDRDLADVDLSSLRGLVNCSEPVTLESQRQFMERFAPHGLADDVFFGCYAMAETTFALTHGTSGDPGYVDHEGPSDATWTRSEGNVSVGRPLPGVSIRIVAVDDADTEMPEGQVGEILVRSPFNFDGYHNQPEASSEAFTDGWYRTGDLGYRVGDELFVPGRQKDVLIVAGVNVFPHDIEDTLGRMEGVHRGRVSAFSSFDERTQTERVVVLAESEYVDTEARDLMIAMRQRLLAAFQIGNFEVHLVPPGWLIKSSSGKMARAANRAKWRGVP